MSKMGDNVSNNKSMKDDMDKILNQIGGAKESISSILIEWGSGDIAKLPRRATDNVREVLLDVEYDKNTETIIVNAFHGIIKDGNSDVTLEKDAEPFYTQTYKLK